MTLIAIPLINDGVLVKGTDSRGGRGDTILDGRQWAQIKRDNEFTTALGGIDEAIAQLIAPIQAAVDKVNATKSEAQLDPLAYVVVNEGSDGVGGVDRQIIKLHKDSILLRALEEGQADRLMWVRDDQLVLAAASQTLDEAVGFGDLTF